ncbi:MAG: hypothetical protein ACREMP_10210 [Candidatus Tyrphobacter sp.]
MVHALALALSVSPSSLALNPAQQATLSVSGAVPPLTATLDRRLVAVAVNAAGTLVTVTATQATGSDVLHLADAADDTADVPIRVAFNAGTIAPQISLVVTGSPLSPDWLAAQIHDAVTNATQALAGAQVTVATPTPTPLAPGATATVNVPVNIAGDGLYFDASGSTNVSVTHEALAPQVPEMLFYDDDPEDVDGSGILYRGSVSVAAPVRLYTYHEDRGLPRTIAVVLEAAQPSRVQLIDAPAGPSTDVMSVGHAVGVEYLTQEPADEGTIVSLSASTPYVLSDTPAADGQLVAEALDMRVLSGGPVSVTLLSLSGNDPLQWLDEPPLPGDGHHRRGVFDLGGFGDEEETYGVGGPGVSVVYGGRHPTPRNVRPDSEGRDYGDYGVLHRFVFTLENPTDTQAYAYLYERPSGQPVRSSFLVDGSLLQVGCAREPVPYLVQAYVLAPDSRYQVVVVTMTDGGSSYPLELGITASLPAVKPPPIDAPGGCFPKS